MKSETKSNLNEILTTQINAHKEVTENNISELKKSKSTKSSDLECLNKYKGKLETYNAMSKILTYGYSVTKVIDLLDSTRNQLKNDICSQLSNHYIGKGRKSPEVWDNLQVLCGKLEALADVRDIIDNAFV